MSQNPPGRRNLQEQAQRLRQDIRNGQMAQNGRRFPEWKKVLYFSVFICFTAGSVFLSISDSNRRHLIQSSAEFVNVFRPGAEEKLYELPAPPPKSVEPRVEMAGGIHFGAGGEFEGVLYSDSDTMLEPEIDSSAEEPDQFVPPPKSPESQKAFDLLMKKFEVAAKLVEDEMEGYQFQEWQPVKDSPPIYFIDLVAQKSDDSAAVHFIWEVNIDTAEVRPMSQAARDLSR